MYINNTEVKEISSKMIALKNRRCINSFVSGRGITLKV